MNKFCFIIDSEKKNNKLKKSLFNKYKNYSSKACKVIIVLGGDGFMLQTLKKYQKYNKPFYGINRGSFGFLMNKYKTSNINKIVSEAKLLTISPLQMKALTKAGKFFTAIAINEVSLLRQTKQTASLQVKNGKKILINKLICDGILISTPAGSTAYNLSVRGPILSLNSKKLAITPISPFRPRRWKGKVVPSTSLIQVNNLDIKKRSVSVVADNVEVRNIKNVKIKINSLIKKIKLEQRRKK